MFFEPSGKVSASRPFERVLVHEMCMNLPAKRMNLPATRMNLPVTCMNLPATCMNPPAARRKILEHCWNVTGDKKAAQEQN
jgi:hypothetical protein